MSNGKVAPSARVAAQVEAEIRRRWDTCDFHGAATLILESYGREVFVFVSARLRDPDLAADAFSMFTENLWSGLPAFGWRCTARGWAYILARNAANRIARSRAAHPRNVPLSAHPALEKIATRIRSATQPHLRTDVKDRIRALRDELPPDDQMLLNLRVDRGMTFRELAVIMEGNGEHLCGEELNRRTAGLRKRFERLKHQLRRRVKESGLNIEEPH